MTQLPTSPHVSEALTFARQWLEKLRHQDFLQTGLPTLHSGAGEVFTLQVIKARAMSGALGMQLVIDLARAGWDEADAALCELYREFRHHHREPPPELVVYAMEALHRPPPRRSRGRRKSRNALQDMMFAVLMAELVHKFALYPTRKTPKHRDSACDILALVVSEAKWLKRSFDYKTAERLFYLWGIGWAQDLARGDPKI
jgi:hypothetical protein